MNYYLVLLDHPRKDLTVEKCIAHNAGFLSCISFAQSGDTLYVNYFSQTPFAYTENSATKGIEIDIVNEYVLWLKSKRK